MASFLLFIMLCILMSKMSKEAQNTLRAVMLSMSKVLKETQNTL